VGRIKEFRIDIGGTVIVVCVAPPQHS